jgi:hypothetical protein
LSFTDSRRELAFKTNKQLPVKNTSCNNDVASHMNNLQNPQMSIIALHAGSSQARLCIMPLAPSISGIKTPELVMFAKCCIDNHLIVNAGTCCKGTDYFK